MNRHFWILILLIVYSCSTTKKSNEKRCKSILTDNFRSVIVDKNKSTAISDSIKLSEVKYECIKSIMQSTKVMYDSFGIWDKVIFPENRNFGVFVWENVKLFENDTTTFNVATSGNENFETIYTSVMVFDKNNSDFLIENSEYKAKLITYFGDLIKSNDSRKRDFFEKYWTKVNPEHWKKIKKNF